MLILANNILILAMLAVSSQWKKLNLQFSVLLFKLIKSTYNSLVLMRKVKPIISQTLLSNFITKTNL